MSEDLSGLRDYSLGIYVLCNIFLCALYQSENQPKLYSRYLLDSPNKLMKNGSFWGFNPKKGGKIGFWNLFGPLISLNSSMYVTVNLAPCRLQKFLCFIIFCFTGLFPSLVFRDYEIFLCVHYTKGEISKNYIVGIFKTHLTN